MEESREIVVSVTKKGQATIPKKLRQTYGIKNKVVMVGDSDIGIIIKPLPSPSDEFGSLKHLYPGKTAHEVVEEGRKADYERDKRLLRHAGNTDV